MCGGERDENYTIIGVEPEVRSVCEAGFCEGNCTIIGMEAEESSVCVAGERGWVLWGKLHYYRNGG